MDHYFNCIALIERLHRRFLGVIKNELERLGIPDINNIQALILYNIGDKELTVGELTNYGYYLGSNVSYNVKKLVENEYLIQERSPHDRRSVRVKLSAKGLELRNQMTKMFENHVVAMGPDSVTADDLEKSNDALLRLERFWSNILEYGARGPNLTLSAISAA